jgi:flagellar assembly protein FliH
MTRALQLEDFGKAEGHEPFAQAMNAPETPAPLQEASLEGGNLEAFEQGYRSGWDDCTANEVEERRRVGADLAAALAEVSLTLDAARDEMLTALQPLFEQIASQLLPAIVSEAVAPAVVNELHRIAEEQCSGVVQLFASPATCPVIENLANATPDLTVTVIPEESLAEGQVSLRFEDKRRDIDLSTAAAQMAEAIRGFAAQTTAHPSLAFASLDDDIPAASNLDIQKGVA